MTITHGEALAPDGSVTIDNCRGISLLQPESLAVPFQTDVVISAGDDSIFEPRHSTKGFRYVQVDGLTETLERSDITSIVVHTDLRPVGSFNCSDDRINRLHAAADWSFRGNACEIPTDCPTRERSGWTGDWQVYVGTAAYLYDVTEWSRKWLFDAAADQMENGAVTEIVPDPYHGGPHGDPGWEFMQGPAGWGDAVCHVPWELYLATGRLDVIGENIDTMKKWLAFAESRAAGARFWRRAKTRPVPLPHERYIWDTGFHFGEWLEPHVELSDMDSIVAALGADMGPTATAFIVRSSRELAAMLRLLDRETEAIRYDILAANALDAWRTEFLDDAGHVQPLTQANLVRAIAFDLLPPDLVDVAVADLVRLIRDADTHVGTGFLATPFLLPVLADHGHLELAYELLFRSTPPSWLTMIDRGATTIWEGWAGIAEDGDVVESSLNHYSKGAVISFLHRYTAGLQIVEPGYRRFRVAPRPGGGITSASTHHDSPFGRIDVDWSIDGTGGTLRVTVPPDTTAELVLPNGSVENLDPGHHLRTW
jgi:alpha-L-rhamnosidase